MLTIAYLASELDPALLPMLPANFIFELGLARVADEVRAVELLHDESIHGLAEAYTVPAIGASIVL